MKKTLYTLNINNYSPKITEYTYPLFEYYAKRIGADFVVITERKFPDMPIVYEKFQVAELGKDNDWNIFIDSDALIHPDCPDVTEVLPKNVVMCFATDHASSRFKYDKYFRRDGRNIGWGNWLNVSSNETSDIWNHLDMPIEEAVKNISTYSCERIRGMWDAKHLIDDYTISRNVARFGLKFLTFQNFLKQIGLEGQTYFFHNHLLDEEAKLDAIKQCVEAWRLSTYYNNNGENQ